MASSSSSTLSFRYSRPLPPGAVNACTAHSAAVKALCWSPSRADILATGGGLGDRSIRLWNVSKSMEAGPICCSSSSFQNLPSSLSSPSPPTPQQHQQRSVAMEVDHVGGGGGAAQPPPPSSGRLVPDGQVSGLFWNEFTNEIASVHGATGNQMAMWRLKGPLVGRNPAACLMPLWVSGGQGHEGDYVRPLYTTLSPDGTTIAAGCSDETIRFWTLFPSPPRDSSDAVVMCGPVDLGMQWTMPLNTIR